MTLCWSVRCIMELFQRNKPGVYDKMSDSSGGLEELLLIHSGLKRCGGGMSSPSLVGSEVSTASAIGIVGNLAGAVAGLPRTHSMSALRSRPPRRAVFWEQQGCNLSTKRDQ